MIKFSSVVVCMNLLILTNVTHTMLKKKEVLINKEFSIVLEKNEHIGSWRIQNRNKNFIQEMEQPTDPIKQVILHRIHEKEQQAFTFKALAAGITTLTFTAPYGPTHCTVELEKKYEITIKE